MTVETYLKQLLELTAPAKTEFGTGDCYETPDNLYNALNEMFNFKFDAFASAKNAKCNDFFTEEDDALSQDWDCKGNVWMNPPYSRGLIDRCMKHAHEQSLLVPSRKIVALVRDDPTTGWYDKYVDGKAALIMRLKHRVKFKGADSCYNFPCCIVVYDENQRWISKDTSTRRWWYE